MGHQYRDRATYRTGRESLRKSLVLGLITDGEQLYGQAVGSGGEQERKTLADGCMREDDVSRISHCTYTA